MCFAEGLFTAWLGAYNPRKVSDELTELCPYDGLTEWRGACSHSPLTEGIRKPPQSRQVPQVTARQGYLKLWWSGLSPPARRTIRQHTWGQENQRLQATGIDLDPVAKAAKNATRARLRHEAEAKFTEEDWADQRAYHKAYHANRRSQMTEDELAAFRDYDAQIMRDFRARRAETETEEEMLARRAKKNNQGKAARAAETTAEKTERVEARNAKDASRTDEVKEEARKGRNATWATTTAKKRAAETPEQNEARHAAARAKTANRTPEQKAIDSSKRKAALAAKNRRERGEEDEEVEDEDDEKENMPPPAKRVRRSS